MSWPPVIGPSCNSPSRAAAVALTPESAMTSTLPSFACAVQHFDKSTVNCRAATVELGQPYGDRPYLMVGNAGIDGIAGNDGIGSPIPGSPVLVGVGTVVVGFLVGAFSPSPAPEPAVCPGSVAAGVSAGVALTAGAAPADPNTAGAGVVVSTFVSPPLGSPPLSSSAPTATIRISSSP